MKTKSIVSALLCVLLVIPPAYGQGAAPRQAPATGITVNSGLISAYQYREEGPISLANSGRLESLVRAGRIYLSLQDAIALALENNLDIEIQRYGPRIADADVLRAEAGGLLRGIPADIQQGSSSALAQVTGTAGGGSTGGGGSIGGGDGAVTTGGAIITTTGTALPNLDPVITTQYQWGHRTVPQTNSFTTGTNSLVLENHAGNAFLRKGFLTGTTVDIGFVNNRTFSNAGRADFNPYISSSLSLQVTQRLLQGFGKAVNNRNIRIARNSRQVSDFLFRQQVMVTVSSIVNLYWDLVSFGEEVKVKKQAMSLAEKLFSDNKKQVEIGTLAPIEIVRAEAEVARGQQELTVAETRVLLQETILKNALSRTGVASPALAEVRIVLTDRIRMPDVEPVVPMQDLAAEAMEKRPEIAQTRLNIESTKIGLQGTKSALRPSLDFLLSFQNNGLTGDINSLPIPPFPGLPPGSTERDPSSVDPFFLGGYGKAMGQVFRRNFPDYTFGFQLNIPLRNRAAQADMVRDQLSLRQQELRQQRLVNQIRVDVTNALTAVQQTRANYRAAMQARVLQEQTLDAEEKKYSLGASTIFFVIQAQRDLAQARSAEVTALSSYSRARVSMDQATGRVLETYNISIDEARQGHVSRPPDMIPAVDQ
jgi:outer membrane protein TolC